MNTQPPAPANATASGPEQGVHPSPHRDRVSPGAMWFCILGAPVAWSVQQLDSITPDPWDAPLDAIVTERGWIAGAAR